MATRYPTHSRPLSEMGLRAEALLGRYPAINDGELAELIDIFPKLPILDVGLITADERIAAKVAELHEAHGDKLAPSNASLAILMIAFLVVPAVTLAVFWLL